jgi:metallo-beta-lactamase family protein
MFLFEYFQGSNVTRVLVDCGSSQEDPSQDRKQRLPKGLNSKEIDLVIISHAHIDHSGFLPKLVKDGFSGPVYASQASIDLMRLLLPDSGYQQEKEAKRMSSKGQPVEALYTEADAVRSLKLFKSIEFDCENNLLPGVSVKLTKAGHILGAAVVNLTFGQGKDKKQICFSGNIGRPKHPILQDLAAVKKADYVICESTYGNKRHEQRSRQKALADLINTAYARAQAYDPVYGCGRIVIPAFAVERAQLVLFDLKVLMDNAVIPQIPVFVDSPMAIKATDIYRRHWKLYNSKAVKQLKQGKDLFGGGSFVECRSEALQKLLQKPLDTPAIVIASSGMATGGRIGAHLLERLPGRNNTIAFVGFQGVGTPGAALVSLKSSESGKKNKMIRLYGRQVRVNATIEHLRDYSAHADYSEILDWLTKFESKPKSIFLVHGEPEALNALKSKIEKSHELGFKVMIPKHRACFDLT